MLQSKSIVGEKAFAFALNAIGIYRELTAGHEYVMSKQFLRAATSIGANIEEASAAQSKRDFAAKMSIASKEARETYYWIRLLHASGYLKQSDSIQMAAEELINMLTAIVKTTQNNLTQNSTLKTQH